MSRGLHRGSNRREHMPADGRSRQWVAVPALRLHLPWSTMPPPTKINATRQRRGGAGQVRRVGGRSRVEPRPPGALERSGTQGCAEKAGGGRVPSLSARLSPESSPVSTRCAPRLNSSAHHRLASFSVLIYPSSG